MPKKLERELLAIAKKRGYSKKRTGAYVYGTLQKIGWKPTGKKRARRVHHSPTITITDLGNPFRIRR